MSEQEIADKLAIQETLTRYSTGLDTPGRKWDEWDRCFALDAVCDYGSMGSSLTPGELRELFSKNDSVRISGQHLLGNFVITVEGDHATARTECAYSSLNRTDIQGKARLSQAGVWFEDELARRSEGWRITARKYEMRWSKSDLVDWKG